MGPHPTLDEAADTARSAASRTASSLLRQLRDRRPLVHGAQHLLWWVGRGIDAVQVEIGRLSDFLVRLKSVDEESRRCTDELRPADPLAPGRGRPVATGASLPLRHPIDPGEVEYDPAAFQTVINGATARVYTDVEGTTSFPTVTCDGTRQVTGVVLPARDGVSFESGNLEIGPVDNDAVPTSEPTFEHAVTGDNQLHDPRAGVTVIANATHESIRPDSGSPSNAPSDARTSPTE